MTTTSFLCLQPRIRDLYKTGTELLFHLLHSPGHNYPGIIIDFGFVTSCHMNTKDLACILIIVKMIFNQNQIHNTGAALSSFGLSASSNGGPTVQSAVGTYCTGIPSCFWTRKCLQHLPMTHVSPKVCHT